MPLFKKDLPCAGDHLICTYSSKGEPKQELWERPDKTRYTIACGSGAVTEKSTGPFGPRVSSAQTYSFKNTCKHKPAGGIAVGDFKVYPFSFSDSREVDCMGLHHIYALTGSLFVSLYNDGFAGTVYGVAFPDRGVLPEQTHRKVLDNIMAIAKTGKKVGFYCLGGHGRTGVILASLIALVEKPDDPIAVTRTRYCKFAVESKLQAERVFALLGKPMPAEYDVIPPAIGGGLTNTVLSNYGFSWWERDKTRGLPKWIHSCTYADMPLLSEIDREVREVYGSFNQLPVEHRDPFFCVTPGISPAMEEKTWWVINRVNGAAVRVAFHLHGTASGTILEHRACLPREYRPYVAITGEPEPTPPVLVQAPIQLTAGEGEGWGI